jgi:uncharacterized protein involved in exopolysaccharide biosynthesis
MTERHPNTPKPPTTPDYPPSQAVYMEEPINWSEYWKVLVEHKKLIGIITAASTILALLTAFLLPSIYRAEALLAPVSHDKSEGLSAMANQFGDLAALAGVNLGTNKDKTAESIAALKSRSLSVAFMEKENLKPILFPRRWNAESKKWKDQDEIPSDWEAFEIFDREIRSVNVDRKSGLVTLVVEWKDPALAAKWATSLVKHVNNRLRTEAIEDAERSIAYLEKQLGSTSSVEIQQAIYRLIETQTKKKMIASTREEYAFTVIDPAVSPEERAKPKRLLIILAGLILGIAAGFTVAWFRRAK